MEILQLSDDSSNEASSDLGTYVPSDSSDEGTLVFSLWDYL